MSLKEHEKTISMCRFCWMCRHACPTFLHTKNDAHTPRAYALELGMVLDGLREFEQSNIARLYQCSQCGLCREVCITHWPEDDMIRGAREEIVIQNKAPEKVKEIRDRTLESGNIFGRPASESWHPKKGPGGKDTVKVGYFAGCSQRFERPEIPLAVEKIFQAAGIPMYSLDEDCCGGPLYDLGYTEDAKTLARRLVSSLSDGNYDRLIIGCPHCLRMLNNIYPKLGITLPTSIELISLPDFISGLIKDKKISLNRIDRTVAFHDPCQLTRNMGLGELPRGVIKTVCGKNPEELFHSGTAAECCGSGTVMRLTDPQIALGVASERLKGLNETRAATLITACQNCKTVFIQANKSKEITILDLSELVADNLVLC